MFWTAFRDKLVLSLGRGDKATRFLSDVMNPRFALCAYERGQLMGMVGFKTSDGGLIGGDIEDFSRIYGSWGAVWRIAILSLFERNSAPGQIVLDGLFVHEEARGRGVGTALIQAVTDHARAVGYSEIRLDVIDRNPRAKQLYLREGFEVVARSRTGMLRPIMGFGTSEMMLKAL